MDDFNDLLDKMGELIKRTLALGREGATQISENEVYGVLGLAADASNTVKIVISIPDRLLARKVKVFLNTWESLDASTLNLARDKFENNPSLLSRVGVLVLEQINRADSETKSQMLGRIFCNYLINGNFDLLSNSCQIVNSMYSSDISYFLGTEEACIGETGDEVEHLISVGAYTRDYGGLGADSALLKRRPRMSDGGKYLHSLLGDV